MPIACQRRALLLLTPLMLAGCGGGGGGAGGIGVATTLTGSVASSQAGLTREQIAALPSEVPPLSVPLDISFRTALAHGDRLVVPAYGVSFIHNQAARAVSQGLGLGGIGGGTRSASVRTGLAGVSPATFQRIADEAYADLLAQLAAAGLRVATPEEAAQIAAAAPRVTGNAADGSSGSTMFGGASTAWRTLGAANAPLIQGLAGEGAGGGLGAMATITSGATAQRVADASQGGLALFPVLRLDYVDVTSSGNSFIGRGASAEATPRFAVAAGSTAMAAVRRPGMGASDVVAMRVASPVASPEPFATMAGQVGRDASLVAFGQRADVTVEAVEARYLALARSAYRGFNAALVQAIRSGRAGA